MMILKIPIPCASNKFFPRLHNHTKCVKIKKYETFGFTYMAAYILIEPTCMHACIFMEYLGVNVISIKYVSITIQIRLSIITLKSKQ